MTPFLANHRIQLKPLGPFPTTPIVNLFLLCIIYTYLNYLPLIAMPDCNPDTKIPWSMPSLNNGSAWPDSQTRFALEWSLKHCTKINNELIWRLSNRGNQNLLHHCYLKNHHHQMVTRTLKTFMQTQGTEVEQKVFQFIFHHNTLSENQRSGQNEKEADVRFSNGITFWSKMTTNLQKKKRNTTSNSNWNDIQLSTVYDIGIPILSKQWRENGRKR